MPTKKHASAELPPSENHVSQGKNMRTNTCNSAFPRALIHKRSIDSHKLKESVHVSVLHSNCKQSITSLSLLVGTTVLRAYANLNALSAVV